MDKLPIHCIGQIQRFLELTDQSALGCIVDIDWDIKYKAQKDALTAEIAQVKMSIVNDGINGEMHYKTLPDGRIMVRLCSTGRDLVIIRGPDDVYSRDSSDYFHIDRIADKKRQAIMLREYHFALYEKMHGLDVTVYSPNSVMA